MSAATRGAGRIDAGRLRGVVFDLDGTLVDSYDAIAESLNHARAVHGLAPLSMGEVRREVGRGLENLVAALVGPDRVHTGVSAFREHYARVFAAGTRALPGVAETLERLRLHGLRLAVASNKPERFSTPILAQLDLLRHFDCVQGPDLAGATKPDPTMIRACLEQLELDTAQAVYVGDMVLDAEAGARAGLPVILVTGGSSTSEELHETGCPVVTSFPALGPLLGL